MTVDPSDPHWPSEKATSLTIESPITMVDLPASDGGDCGEGSWLRAWNLFDRHRLGCVGRVRRLDWRLDPTLVHCALGTQGVEQAESERWVAGGGRSPGWESTQSCRWSAKVYGPGS
ncbi:hypothetical protein AAFF_G00210850 [Aldrovandia affinis]|uniref:Uncharacterized protein n=1 Tax=Aldrovandia affinis TaxID=143900 RepID=A0AAD7SWD8_9TELE|nr:hypothetical protein AAFF_G00210850 [Aldrovandia affinis]